MSMFYISLLIGVLALDTTIAFQVLIAQPIFSCSIIGAALGDFSAGLEIGLMMQLLWLNIVPSGATRFPEGNLASMVICAGAILFELPQYPNMSFALIVLVGIAVSYVGMRVTIWQRRSNDVVFGRVLTAIEAVQPGKIVAFNALAILTYFLAMSLLAFVSLGGIKLGIDYMMPILSEQIEGSARFLKPGIWAIGITLVGRMIYRNFIKKG